MEEAFTQLSRQITEFLELVKKEQERFQEQDRSLRRREEEVNARTKKLIEERTIVLAQVNSIQTEREKVEQIRKEAQDLHDRAISSQEELRLQEKKLAERTNGTKS